MADISKHIEKLGDSVHEVGQFRRELKEAVGYEKKDSSCFIDVLSVGLSVIGRDESELAVLVATLKDELREFRLILKHIKDAKAKESEKSDMTVL